MVTGMVLGRGGGARGHGEHEDFGVWAEEGPVVSPWRTRSDVGFVFVVASDGDVAAIVGGGADLVRSGGRGRTGCRRCGSSEFEQPLALDLVGASWVVDEEAACARLRLLRARGSADVLLDDPEHGAPETSGAGWPRVRGTARDPAGRVCPRSDARTGRGRLTGLPMAPLIGPERARGPTGLVLRR